MTTMSPFPAPFTQLDPLAQLLLRLHETVLCKEIASTAFPVPKLYRCGKCHSPTTRMKGPTLYPVHQEPGPYTGVQCRCRICGGIHVYRTTLLTTPEDV